MRKLSRLILAVILSACTATAEQHAAPPLASAAQIAEAEAEPFSPQWTAINQPFAPFNLIGNIYYVGANDVTSYLIVTPEGDILLDGGFAQTAPMIEAHIVALGFSIHDVKFLLNS